MNSIKAKDLKLDYLRKSKDQKVFAYTLLATGLTLGGVGSLYFTSLGYGWGESSHSSSGSGTTLVVTGVAAVVGSIILFNEAAKKQKKSKASRW